MPSYLQYNTNALHYINSLILGATNIKVKFKNKFVGLSSCLSLLHTLARLMSERCSCIRSKVDHCIYSKEKGGNFIYVALYVDDMFLIEKSIDAINKIKKKLSSKFDMKHIDSMNFIFGMEIKRYRVARKI
jgi:hypothetical protein